MFGGTSQSCCGNRLYACLTAISSTGTYAQISSNYIQSPGADGIDALTTHASIKNNTILSPTSYGIRIINSTYSTVSENFIKSSGQCSIFIDNSASCLVSGNYCLSSTTQSYRAVSADNCSFVSNYSASSTGSSFYTSSCEDLLISDNFVQYAGSYAFQIDAANHAVLTDNLIHFSAASAIAYNLTGIGGKISGNTIYNTTGSAISILNSCSHVEVSDNSIITCSAFGILTTGANEVLSIVNNFIYDCQIGIELYCDNSMVSGNFIENTTQNGIHIVSGARFLSVCNNLIRLTGWTCIFVEGGGPYTINSNFIQCTTAGITILGPGGASTLNVTVSANFIYSGSGHAISVSAASSFISITSNLLVDQGTWGIYCLGDYASIVGNTINNPGTIAIDSAGDFAVISSNNIKNSGHRSIVSGGHNANISANMIVDSAEDGISIEGDYCNCSGNSAISCVHSGIECISDFNIIDANICEGNTTYGIDVTAAADRIIITSNLCLNNGTANMRNLGTTTTVANNIVA